MKKVIVAAAIALTTQNAFADCNKYESAVIEGIKRVVLDPTSVLIKDVMIYKVQNELIGAGLVNGKNLYGGYTGFTPFAIAIIDNQYGPAIAVAPVIRNTPRNNVVHDKVYQTKMESGEVICK